MQFCHRIILIAGLAASVAVADAMPTGAFLRKPAYKTSDLLAALRNDPVVADRYVRHFRMSKGQLAEYFSTLRLAKLDTGGAYTVYNVHDSILRSRVLNLKKGTLVFADSTGRPILQQVCGNPMVWRVPPIAAEPIVSAPATGDITSVVDEGTAVVVGASVAEPGVAEIPTTPPPLTPPTITSRNNSGLLLIPLILGIGAATMFNNDDDCPPVPEPATMTALAIGGAALLRKRRKKA